MAALIHSIAKLVERRGEARTRVDDSAKQQIVERNHDRFAVNAPPDRDNSAHSWSRVSRDCARRVHSRVADQLSRSTIQRSPLGSKLPAIDGSRHHEKCARGRADFLMRNSHMPLAHDPLETVAERRREVRTPVSETASIRLLSPLEPERVEARILDISRNGMKIFMQRPVAPGVIIQIRLRDTIVAGEVRHCLRVKDGFNVGLYIQDRVERRLSKRVKIEIPATMFEVGAIAQPRQEYPVKILDKSEKGLLVAVGKAMPVGAAVRIIAGAEIFLAEVIHCQAAEDGFRIGVEVDQVLAPAQLPKWAS